MPELPELPARRQRFLPDTRAGSAQQFAGPLGLWPWPLINLILMLSQRNRPAPRMSLWEIQRDQSGRIIGILKWDGVQ